MTRRQCPYHQQAENMRFCLGKTGKNEILLVIFGSDFTPRILRGKKIQIHHDSDPNTFCRKCRLSFDDGGEADTHRKSLV